LPQNGRSTDVNEISREKGASSGKTFTLEPYTVRVNLFSPGKTKPRSIKVALIQGFLFFRENGRTLIFGYWLKSIFGDHFFIFKVLSYNQMRNSRTVYGG
jgi:hypothetical protein